MYITCEQCSTIFRLDDRRLKPTGSKVRCSQCGSIFIAWPMASTQNNASPVIGESLAVEESLAQSPEDTFDQELNGIDLAELDSILERDRKVDHTPDEQYGDLPDEEALTETNQLDEADLDLDFESALALDAEPAAEDASAGTGAESEELDLEMDFELESEAPPDNAQGAAGEIQLEDELEMDFELDDAADLQAEAMQEEQKVDDDVKFGENEIELALDDFEDALGAPAEDESDIPLQEEAVEEDLSLDMDLDLDEAPDQAGTEDDELELSLDDGEPLGAAREAASETGAIPAAGAENKDLDLTDLDSLLDEDEEPQDAPAESEDIELSLDDDLDAGEDTEPLLELEAQGTSEPEPEADAAGAAEDDIDLGGFDDLLAEDGEAEDTEVMDQELSLDDDADFDLDKELDLGPELETGGATEASAGEVEDGGLDLGGLDDLLDDSDGQAVDTEPEDLELSLEDGPGDELSDDSVLEMATDEKADENIGGLEDLEFELDAEFEDKPISRTASGDQAEETREDDEELDLSDIEKMLEDDALTPEPAPEQGDLELDLTGGAEKWVDEVSRSAEGSSEGEFDLTEIEAAIDEDDDGAGEDLDDDNELELDLEPFEGEKQEQDDELDLALDLEDDASTTGARTMGDDTDEIDLSDVDLSIEEEKPENEIINAGDLELEFQIEDNQPAVIDSTETLTTEARAETRSTATFDDEANVTEAEEQLLIEEAFTEKPKAAKPVGRPKPVQKQKKGTSKSLVAILILLLLGGGGYFGYDYVVKNNITIPYLSDYINPKPKDPNGTAMLSTLEINSKFIENEKAGRIFVVTGKIRNGYSVPCKMIQLNGKLFIKGKVLAKTETAYAGLIINDTELAGQDIGQIKQRLKTPGGQAASNVVGPGLTIPFMVVFSELPADLDEFAIELVRSSKGQ